VTLRYEDFELTFPDQADWNLVSVLRRRAGEQPDAVYLDTPDEGRSWTYAESLAFAERVARSFLHAGARPGDRVMVMAVNSSAYVKTWFGTTFAGLVEVPLNTAYERDFLAHQVRVSSPRWAVIDDTYAERFLDILADCSTVERFWVVDTGHGDAARKLLTEAGFDAVPWDELEVEHDGELPTIRYHDLASIFFTSGTTGPSKGVAMPHAQMYFFAEENVNMHKLTAQDVYLATTPLFHGNAQFLAAYPALVAGARFVLRKRFSASRWIDQVRESGVTVTNFIGVMMDFVWKQPARPNDADNKLRSIYAAPTAWSVYEDFKQRFGIEAFVDAFGLTETSQPFITPYGMPRPAGACGLLVADWFDARLVDPDTDLEVPVGTVGELVIRPQQPWTCSMGYYGMPEKTVEAWRNLWFHTGDALKRDEQGWYYFVDRYKDALRRRGENISSYEVEQAILGHESIVECAVIGVPADVEAGEDEVLACIVGTGEPDPQAIWAWCRTRLPSFAVPRYLRFVTQLPKSQSQKIQKAQLRKQGITADTYDVRDYT
jgi:carnitine-CoA ligase